MAVTRLKRSKDKGDLRSGFTTGACAAAAARAAARALLHDAVPRDIGITLPNGDEVRFAVHPESYLASNTAYCAIIKDAGDDPDCTHEAAIWAKVQLRQDRQVNIDGGQGVARITKPGLELPVGMAAINPVPRRNITEMVQQELADSRWHGADIEISVPDGEARAKETIGERLGLIGGISILGTRGTVKPYSTSAFAASVRQSIQVASLNGERTLVLTTGSRTERFAAQHFPALNDSCLIQAGDFVGVGLRGAARCDVDEIRIVAMIGKLAKMVSGTLMTHVSGRRIDFELLARIATEQGASLPLADAIRQANTGRHVLELLQAEPVTGLYNRLCQEVAQHAYRYARRTFPVRVYLIDFAGQLLGESQHKQ